MALPKANLIMELLVLAKPNLNDKLQQEQVSDREFTGYLQDIFDKIYQTREQLDLAMDLNNAWCFGFNQSLYFQNYPIKADLRLDEGKGMSFGDLHYFDQVRFY